MAASHPTSSAGAKQGHTLPGSVQATDSLLAAQARLAVDALRDHAREHCMSHKTRDPLVMAIHKAIDSHGDLLAVCKAFKLAVEAQNGDAEAYFNHDTWNPDAHVEITVTVADIRAMFAALSRARGGAE